MSLRKIRNVYDGGRQAVKWEATFSNRYWEPMLRDNRPLGVACGDFKLATFMAVGLESSVEKCVVACPITSNLNAHSHLNYQDGLCCEILRPPTVGGDYSGSHKYELNRCQKVIPNV